MLDIKGRSVIYLLARPRQVFRRAKHYPKLPKNTNHHDENHIIVNDFTLLSPLVRCDGCSMQLSATLIIFWTVSVCQFALNSAAVRQYCPMFSKIAKVACGGKAKYDKGWVAPTDLLRELQVHPCCDIGCSTTILGLPASQVDVCSCRAHRPTFTGYCGLVTTVGNLSEAERQVRFLELINANRAPFDKF